jgi:predicted RNA binding protein YcfA (HicA-like mRNA interferase family)
MDKLPAIAGKDLIKFLSKLGFELLGKKSPTSG